MCVDVVGDASNALPKGTQKMVVACFFPHSAFFFGLFRLSRRGTRGHACIHGLRRLLLTGRKLRVAVRRDRRATHTGEALAHRGVVRLAARQRARSTRFRLWSVHTPPFRDQASFLAFSDGRHVRRRQRPRAVELALVKDIRATDAFELEVLPVHQIRQEAAQQEVP